jgi:hypothetical protein
LNASEFVKETWPYMKDSLSPGKMTTGQVDARRRTLEELETFLTNDQTLGLEVRDSALAHVQATKAKWDVDKTWLRTTPLVSDLAAGFCVLAIYQNLSWGHTNEIHQEWMEIRTRLSEKVTCVNCAPDGGEFVAPPSPFPEHLA